MDSNEAPATRSQVIAIFKHYSTAVKALRGTDSKHFVQGPNNAWWFDEIRASDMTRLSFCQAKAEMARAWA